MSGEEVAAAMGRLREAERAKREAIDELVALGFVRSRRLVADIGEELAARYFGVSLAPNANNPGYDLETRDGRRLQVRALRSDPDGERTVMGAMRDPYDALFAIKLSLEYEPLRAIDVPREVLERHYPHGTRTSWTKRLENDPGVERSRARSSSAAPRCEPLSAALSARTGSRTTRPERPRRRSCSLLRDCEALTAAGAESDAL